MRHLPALLILSVRESHSCSTKDTSRKNQMVISGHPKYNVQREEVYEIKDCTDATVAICLL